MQVWHRLTGIATTVDDQTKTGLVKADRLGHPGCRQQQMAEQGLIVLPGVGDAGKGFPWKNKHVNRGLRIDIVNREAKIVLVGDFCRQLAVDDPLEDGLGHGFRGTAPSGWPHGASGGRRDR